MRVDPLTPFSFAAGSSRMFPAATGRDSMAHSTTKFVSRPVSTPPSKRSAKKKRGHILIVAVESLMREFVDSVLRQAGYATVRAVDPPEAVGMAEQFGPFDLLIAS